VASGNLFLSDHNGQSLRRAVVEDDGDVAFLYLTAPHLTKIAATAWIYNRTSSVFGACRDLAAADWALLWSHDGHSVAVLADDFPLACIVNATNPGYSRDLTAPTSVGNTWDDLLYARIFGRV
jgi:hypothetical protein